MNAPHKPRKDRELALKMFRYGAEWDRQFALLPLEERKMITANPMCELAQGLRERVMEAIDLN
jgi:hypothetical protein